MDKDTYMESIKPLDLPRARRKEAMDKTTPQEYKAYRSLSGSIILGGNGSLTQAALVGSYMQQIAPRLRVQNLTESNKMLKEVRDLEPRIMFPILKADVERLDLWTFSDESFNIVAGRDYGQTGIVIGINVRGKDEESAFHLVDWASSKQRRVSHSSYGAEILAFSDAYDRGYYVKQAIRAITNRK